MERGRSGPDAGVIGREPELARLEAFLSPGGSAQTLLLTGGPGIGKTTLWEAGIGLAAERGFRVLATRATGAEARLTFSALSDLFEDVDLGVLEGLPSPRRRALETALLRTEAAPEGPEPLAIATGTLDALRSVASREPVLVAVDDVQWLDQSSGDALSFAARRIRTVSIRFLLTRRSGASSTLEKAMRPEGIDHVAVEGLSLGAMRRMLSERLGLSLPRVWLRRVLEASQGNPLFALELGRTLAASDAIAIGDELPFPDHGDDPFGPRVVRLPGPQRRALLAVALSGSLRASELGAVADPTAVEDAEASGLLVVDRRRVRTSHPLVAVAARRHSSARTRRQLHLDLARAVHDPTLRARHLALGTVRPDADVAAVLATAAAVASARGSRADAIELAEQALRLTPPEADEHTDRLLDLADHLLAAGQVRRMADLLAPQMESLPSGASRARAWLLRAEAGDVRTLDEYASYLDRALTEDPDDPAVRAEVLAKKARAASVCYVERIPQAEAWALDALEAASSSAPHAQRVALAGLGWARVFSGRSVDDLCERFRGLPGVTSFAADPYSPDPARIERLAWRGEVSRTRADLSQLRSVADEQGEAGSSAVLGFQLCHLGIRTGDWGESERILDEWESSGDHDLLMSANYEYCRALVAAGRGDPAEARRWADTAITLARMTGNRFDEFFALWARGTAALLEHDPERAAESLRTVWDHTEGEGVRDPGAFPVAPDLVEALGELGDTEQARAVTGRLLELAEEQDHPWGLLTARRCGAMVELATGWSDEAAAELDDDAESYGRLGLRFDRPRCLLLLGRDARRSKKWALARRALERAAEAFEDLGSTGWAEQARAELGRIGGRRGAPAGQLTPAERQVVDLAARGRSNKQIARTLSVTVNTVEVHLAHAFAKLGVHSRGQLSEVLSSSVPPSANR